MGGPALQLWSLAGQPGAEAREPAFRGLQEPKALILLGKSRCEAVGGRGDLSTCWFYQEIRSRGTSVCSEWRPSRGRHSINAC